MNNRIPDHAKGPFVSVIVPVYNDPIRIEICIRALLEQTYPEKQYEILVVDNASTDNTRTIIQKYPVKLLIENDIQSSYAARNRGLAAAKGVIIAFTDSDCIPVNRWIETGVNGLKQHSAQLVSGNVRFNFSNKNSGAEIWDSSTNMQIERNILERNVSKTANLFVRKEIFNQIGTFPSNLKSGGDVIWTARATKSGYKLAYIPDAEVAHPTRGLIAMIKKQYRVGKGQIAIWNDENTTYYQYFKRILRTLLPSKPSVVIELITKRQAKLPKLVLFRTYLASWMISIAAGLGNLAAINTFTKGKTNECD